MKKKSLFLILVLVIALTLSVMLSGCTKAVSAYDVEVLNISPDADEPAVYNLAYKDLDAVQKHWTLAGGSAISSIFSVTELGIKMNTASGGYATLSQKVRLKSYSYYKVDYRFITSAMTAYDTEISPTYIGLYVGFAEDENFNIGEDKPTETWEKDTNGKATFYFETDGTREYTFTVYLGSEEHPVSADATITSISLTRVSKETAVAGSATYQLYEFSNSVYGRASQVNVVYVILGAIATLILAFVLYSVRARHLGFESLNTSPTTGSKFYDFIQNTKFGGIIFAVGAAALVRLLIALVYAFIGTSANTTSIFFGYELDNLVAAGSWLAKYSPVFFYKYTPATVEFMPFTLYLSALAGLIGNGIGDIEGAAALAGPVTTATVMKLFAIIADLGAVVLIYKFVEMRPLRKMSASMGEIAVPDRAGASIMAAGYGLMPIIFCMSSLWDSVESISAFFVLLAFYMLVKRNYIGMACSYFTACMFSVSALYVTPIILFYTAMVVYKAIKNKEYKKLIPVAAALVGSIVLFYLIVLPFSYNYVAAGDAFFGFDKYIATVKGANLYTANAFNFQALLGNNFTEVATASTFVTLLFDLFVIGVFGVAYFRSKDRRDLTLLGASLILVLWIFTNNMSPVTLLAALPLLYAIAAQYRDNRLFIAFAIYATLMFVNVAYVDLMVGYTSAGWNAIDYDNTAMLYVFGALNLVACVYYVVVAYDVLVNRKVSSFYEIRVKYAVFARNWSTNAKIGVRNFGTMTRTVFTTLGEAVKEDIAAVKQKKLDRKQGSREGEDNDPADDEE